MTDLHIFDPYDQRLAILSTKAENACPFWEAPFKELLNNGSEFEFTCPADHPDSQYVIAESQAAFRDKDGKFRLFVIRETEDSDGTDGPEIHAICEPAMLELNDEIIEDKRPNATTAKVALTDALAGSRWQVGTVASLGTNGTNFYYISATEAITKIINTWGGELRDRVEVDETGITGRYIDIPPRRGADTGKRWEIDKDIVSIARTVQSYPKTALYGRGSSIESGDGFSRKIDFADVVWSKSNGDPIDKPEGQKWAGDPDALTQFGRLMDDDSLRHRFGIFEDGEEEDPAALLQKTWAALQEQKKPLENYEMDVFLLEKLTGYEHEKVRLGDTSFAIDRRFAKPIEVEERVISFEYDVANPNDTGTVELGQFIDLNSDDRRLDEIESRLNDKSGIWDQGGGPITDDKFPDKTPPVPANFEATGLFKTIALSWVYDSSSYIAAYEVYGSQIKGFTPDASNLLWRGRTGGYAHDADVDQQWYYRARAVNTHGTVSPWTVEVQANTQRIITDDMLFGSVTSDILADLAVDAEKLADGAVTETKVGKAAIGTAAIQNAAITNAHLGDAIIDFAQMKKAIITDELVAPNAKIDFAKIANVEITNAMITGKLDANKVQIGAGTGFADGYDPTKIEVGSRNILRNSDFSRDDEFWRFQHESSSGIEYDIGPQSTLPYFKNHLRITRTNANTESLAAQDGVELEKGKKYTISAWVAISEGVFHLQHGNGDVGYSNKSFDKSDMDSGYTRVSWTFEASDSLENIYAGAKGSDDVKIYIIGVKLERGNRVTDWTPSPEDNPALGWRYQNTTFIDGGALYNNSVTTNKLKAGTIDAGLITIKASNGKANVQLDDHGLTSTDSSGNTRIFVGIRNLAGKGQSDPSTILFYSGSGSTAASVGMNVNDDFIIGSDSNKVAMELRSGKNTINYAQQHRFVMTNTSSQYAISRYWNMTGTVNSTDDYNPMFIPAVDGYGYVGSPSFYLWQVRAKHVYTDNLHDSSTRERKENIHDADLADLQRIFDNMKIRNFNRKVRDNLTSTHVNTGIIAEESPSEVLDEEQTSVMIGSALFTIAGALKYQQKRIDELEKN